MCPEHLNRRCMLLGVCTLFISGCDPMISVAGAHFPVWMLCLFAGILGVAGPEAAIRSNWHRRLDDPAPADLFLSCTGNRLPVLVGKLAMSAPNPRSPQPARARVSRPRWTRPLGRILSGALVLAAVVLSYFIYEIYYSNPRTDDAYVQANTAAVAAHVSGQIDRLPIEDNQHVNKGDLLFVVDPRPYKLALDTARTGLNLAQIEIKTLRDTIASAAAALAERKVNAANAKQYLDRIVPLHAHDFVTDNDVVEARNKLKAADAAVASAASEYAKAQDALGVHGQRKPALTRGAGSSRRRATQLRLLLRAGAVRWLCHQFEHRGRTIRQHWSTHSDARGCTPLVCARLFSGGSA